MGNANGKKKGGESSPSGSNRSSPQQKQQKPAQEEPPQRALRQPSVMEQTVTTQGMASGASQALVKEHVGTVTTIHDIYDGVPRVGGHSKTESLGQGGTASVYKIRHKVSGNYYALKIVKLNRITDWTKREMLLREIKLIKLLDHPNTIKVFEVFQQMNTMYIVMELCTGGELFDRLYAQPGARFTEQKAKVLLRKMLRALAYLHQNGIVHRDLKLENFIFTSEAEDAELKLIDFGFSRQYLHSSVNTMSNFVGTCYYIAPEVIKKDYTEASDLWSLGVVAYMLVTGAVPFGGRTNEDIIRNVETKSKDPKQMRKDLEHKMKNSRLTSNCIDFILSLLEVDQSTRATASQALEHPWVSKSEGDTLQGPTDIERRESEITDNFRKFKTYGQLKRTALLGAAMNMTHDELRSMNKMFEDMDENNDGLISFDEFSKAMAKQGHENVQEAFDAIDQDHTGVIKYSEFIAAALEEKTFFAQEKIEEAFHRLDLDDTGMISIENLKSLLPPDIEASVAEEILKQADYSQDGNIDLAEFKAALAATPMTTSPPQELPALATPGKVMNMTDL